jgi:hypothetical protein
MLMAFAVDLKRQPGLIAIEVEDVWADRMLPTEASASKATAAESTPDHHLWQRHCAPKTFGAGYGQLRSIHAHNLIAKGGRVRPPPPRFAWSPSPSGED